MGKRGKLEKIMHLISFALCEKACLPYIYLPKEKQTDILVTTFFLSQKHESKSIFEVKRKQSEG